MNPNRPQVAPAGIQAGLARAPFRELSFASMPRFRASPHTVAVFCSRAHRHASFCSRAYRGAWMRLASLSALVLLLSASQAEAYCRTTTAKQTAEAAGCGGDCITDGVPLYWAAE